MPFKVKSQEGTGTTHPSHTNSKHVHVMVFFFAGCAPFLSQQLFSTPIDGGKLNLSGPKFEHLSKGASERERCYLHGRPFVWLPCECNPSWCSFTLMPFLLLSSSSSSKAFSLRACVLYLKASRLREWIAYHFTAQTTLSLRHSPSSTPPTPPLSVHAIEGNFQSESASIWVCALQEGTHKFADCYKGLFCLWAAKNASLIFSAKFCSRRKNFKHFTYFKVKKRFLLKPQFIFFQHIFNRLEIYYVNT
jgi:hypothetical protein